eukprot:TRINITY_DN1455_c0_g8_i1.p1 TRINITY_DN1455_c0_g8~~TRINITY_DN1455_c0_g8_i1.p1  ORF type:complete len:303 (+),score=15.19 TRINITY_DN1455_c0_g8_i1:280-1188(+)
MRRQLPFRRASELLDGRFDSPKSEQAFMKVLLINGWHPEFRATDNRLGLSLSPLTGLRSLVYSKTADQEFALALGNLSRLTRLVLASLPVSLTLPTSIVRLNVDVVKVNNLHQLSRLRHLCVINGWHPEFRATDNRLGLSLSPLTGLRSLIYSKAADQEFALALGNLSRLTRLVLASLPVSLTLPTSIVRLVVDVEKINNLHQLSRLTHLSPIYWDEANLWDIPHLQTLCFARGAGPADYSRLSRLQSLRRLHVGALVDADIHRLCNLTMLTSLKVSDGLPRADMYDVLKSLLPTCVIKFVV